MEGLKVLKEDCKEKWENNKNGKTTKTFCKKKENYNGNLTNFDKIDPESS